MASVAEERWPKFQTRWLIFRDLKIFSERFPSRASLVVLLQLTTSELLERRSFKMSFITCLAYHYTSHGLASGSFFEEPQLRQIESWLTVRRRKKASHSVRSPPSAPGKYFFGFRFASGRGYSEHLAGNSLSLLIAE